MNSITTAIYFGFIFLILFLFYFIKEKKLINIIDTKIGLGDVFLFIAIGLTFEMPDLILFFTVSFIIAAVIGLILVKKQKTIPLAGIMVWCHCTFILFAELLFNFDF